MLRPTPRRNPTRLSVRRQKRWAYAVLARAKPASSAATWPITDQSLRSCPRRHRRSKAIVQQRGNRHGHSLCIGGLLH